MARSSLADRVDKLEETMKSLADLPIAVARLDDRVGELGGSVSRLEVRMTSVESQIVELGTEMRGGFSAIRVETKGLFERLDRVEGRLDGIDGRLDGIDGRLDGIDGRLDGIDGRLDGIDGRLDGIDGRLDGIDGRLDRVEQKVDGTRVEMRVLHEEVIARLALLAEGLRQPPPQ